MHVNNIIMPVIFIGHKSITIFTCDIKYNFCHSHHAERTEAILKHHGRSYTRTWFAMMYYTIRCDYDDQGTTMKGLALALAVVGVRLLLIQPQSVKQLPHPYHIILNNTRNNKETRTDVYVNIIQHT